MRNQLPRQGSGERDGNYTREPQGVPSPRPEGVPRGVQLGDGTPNRPPTAPAPGALRPGAGYPTAPDSRNTYPGTPRAAEGRNPGQNSPEFSGQSPKGSLPNQNRFADDFFRAGLESETDDALEAESQTKRMLIFLTVGALGVALLVLIVVLLFQGRKNSVRLEKRTTEAIQLASQTEKNVPVTTTMAVPTKKDPLLTIQTKNTTASTTLTPVQTDPYENPPEWTAPTQPSSQTLMTQPPEQVLPSWNWNTPSSGNQFQPAPADPGFSFSIVQPGNPEPVPEQTPAPSKPTEPLEPQPADLPQPPQSVDLLQPVNQGGRVLIQEGKLSFLSLDNLGSTPVVTDVSGDYQEAYLSPDRSHLVALQSDGRVLLTNLPEEPFELEIQSPQKLGSMMGNLGFGYMSGDGQLYYKSYGEGGQQLVAPSVSEALMAENPLTGETSFVVVREGEVIQLLSDQTQVTLLDRSTGRGQPRLIFYSQQGEFLAFEDDSAVYFYRPSVTEGQVVRIEKQVDGSAITQRTAEGDESLVYTPGGTAIVRFNREGQLSTITLSTGTMEKDALMLPLGRNSVSAYERLAIVNGGNLYLTNESALLDAQQGTYGSQLVDSEVVETVGGGNSLFWVTANGTLRTMAAHADLKSDTIPAQTLVRGAGANTIAKLTTTQDGQTLYYISNGDLYRVTAGQLPQVAYENVLNYQMTPDGSRVYVITNGGGLIRLTDQGSDLLAVDGSGIQSDALKLNETQSRSGNQWIGNGPICWYENGEVRTETP